MYIAFTYSQVSYWSNEFINFLDLRITRTDPAHTVTEILGYIAYLPIVFSLFNLGHHLKDKFTARWSMNFPRLRKMVVFCHQQGINREQQAILINMGAFHYIYLQHEKNKATDQSNYEEFKARLEEESQSKWIKSKILVLCWLANIWQEVVFTKNTLLPCTVSYIKARFF
jgi:hypothetical protein